MILVWLFFFYSEKSSDFTMDDRAKTDEMLHLNEIHNEAMSPLTASITNLEILPSVHSRIDITSDTETETDDTEKLKVNGMPIGFQNRSGPNSEHGHSQDPTAGLTPHPSHTSIYPTTLVPPDVNVYQHKKTLAQGMMDLALLSANANQMRYVLQTDGRHPYFYPSLTMIGMSLFMQIAVGIGLIWNSVYNVKHPHQMCKANQANNWTVIGIFLVTILNVFISSFNVIDNVAEDPVPT